MAGRQKVQNQRAPKKTGSAVQRVGIDRKRILALGAIVVIVGIVLGVLLTRGSSPSNSDPATGSSGVFASFAPNICPLTDTPAPGGLDPRRPALAVKIGNEPNGARPQSGLNEADIVYDTPAEGGVMRYVAVYQCQDASAIGPTRSVRYVDWHIIRQFLHPILAHAGGIIPDLKDVTSSKWLEDADLLTNAASASYRTTTRVAPDNLYVTTKALYSLFPSETSPPPPVFQYSSATPPGAKALTSAQINFSYDTDAIWTWNGSAWTHSYASSGPDIDSATNQPVTATNVVIEIVKYKYGKYPESPGSTGDVESQTTGSGSGYVLRNGTMTAVTWHRPDLINPTTFTSAKGQAVKLDPGRTWVELVLNTTAKNPGAITFTP